MLIALTSSAALIALQLDGYRWSEDALVPADGRPHVVPVDAGRPALLWTYDAYASPDCAVADAGSGADLTLDSTDRALRREGGSAGDWVASATFAPTSDLVEVTCAPTGAQPPILVAVEAAPRVPAFAALGPAAIVPAALGTAGIALLVGAATSRSRTRGSAD